MRTLTSSTLKRVSVWLAGTLVSVTLIPVVGQWFIELAKERGTYDHPSQRLSAFATQLEAMGHSAVLHWAAGLAVAFALGAYLDGVLRRRENAAQIPPAMSSGQTEADRAELERLREAWLGEPRNACLLVAGLVDGVSGYFYRKRRNAFAPLVRDKSTRLRQAQEALDRMLGTDSIATLDEAWAALRDVLNAYRNCAAWVNRAMRADPYFLTNDEGQPNRLMLEGWRADHVTFARSIETLMRRSAYHNRPLALEDDAVRILLDDDRWGEFAPLPPAAPPDGAE
jgi:hypothetical protein